MEHLLTIKDLKKEEINELFSLTKKLKEENKEGIAHNLLTGKSLGMIFAKSSTRTRVSFEVGIYQLGGQGVFLSSNDIQLGRGESISDTAKVLSRYLDGIMIRTFAHSDVEKLAEHGSIPIINGLTDSYHPCQGLTDLFTVYEHKGQLSNLKLTYIGDGNNVAHSLLLATTKMGMDISIATPSDYRPDAEVLQVAKEWAAESGSQVEVVTDPLQAAQEADVLYTDVWASMGDEAEKEERKEAFKDYQVNTEVMNVAQDDAIFLHCLPAHRGEEVTADVIDGEQSVVFDQAENRMHVQKAIMVKLMK
ncbi:ornithine carbamoyltransferase [Natroniella sulfidigena]|uniref:ornithine carbamoyltransferase n=1 Tax=Natroniella sulfidigena TaxID=723921 RepID=UPI00200A44CC|nr:ornithine carbamoyltransferase [Natroniella sulfidigena]MCK8817392.1 ornithine carbamoyltransferase [Natroniella sulfidigena]